MLTAKTLLASTRISLLAVLLSSQYGFGEDTWTWVHEELFPHVAFNMSPGQSLRTIHKPTGGKTEWVHFSIPQRSAEKREYFAFAVRNRIKVFDLYSNVVASLDLPESNLVALSFEFSRINEGIGKILAATPKRIYVVDFSESHPMHWAALGNFGGPIRSAVLEPRDDTDHLRAYIGTKFDLNQISVPERLRDHFGKTKTVTAEGGVDAIAVGRGLTGSFIAVGVSPGNVSVLATNGDWFRALGSIDTPHYGKVVAVGILHSLRDENGNPKIAAAMSNSGNEPLIFPMPRPGQNEDIELPFENCAGSVISIGSLRNESIWTAQLPAGRQTFARH